MYMSSFVYMVSNNDEYALPFAWSSSPKELASMLGVCVMTIYRWINDCCILGESEIVVHSGKWLFSACRLCSSPSGEKC